FSSRRRHTRFSRDWSSDVCSSDLTGRGRGPDGGRWLEDRWRLGPGRLRLRRHRRARLTEPRFVHGPHQHGAGRTHERTVIMQYTDPPGMPDDERMTPAEFRVVREFLGLTPEWLAAHLGVSGRTVRHWEQGKYAIPDGVRL